MIVLDTNIAIAYFNNERLVVDHIAASFAKGKSFLIPTVVIVELLSFPKLTAAMSAQITAWLDDCTVISLDLNIAKQAAALRRASKLKLSDCVIAATAKFYNAALATRDQEFHKIRELKILAW